MAVMEIRRIKLTVKKLLSGAFIASAGVAMAANGWPAQYEGVMLQGFYWDSYKGTNNTKWTSLTSDAEELSDYFRLIWVPNSAKAASNPSMGYDPVYWFTQHNSSFGTRSQLDAMINTFREKGTGIIADVVINHRSGVSNWTNFPSETWNGETFVLGPEHICCTDEVKYQSGQATPTGAPDTGEDFNGARDLDHTSATVQYNCKNYCKFLLQELGYAGFRLDMVKGYAPQYTKIYNEYSNPTFSVGEYWDGSYDALKAWIDGTGKTSAAFDFAFKYAVNSAFGSRDYSRLCWKAGSADQPAGLIHYAYQRYAVTFIDNHDTCRDSNKFSGNIPAANAFMLSCPGTPCVFMKHWQEYKEQIKPMIKARMDAGIHNESAVRVIRCSADCYMAEVTGKKGTLAVKIGPAVVTPEGYSNADIRCAGTDYCIWVKTNGGGQTPTGPANMYLIGNLSGGNWSTTNPVVQTSKSGNTYVWKDAELVDSSDGYSYFSFVTTKGSNWDAVNRSDRYGARTHDEIVSTGGNAVELFRANENASSAFAWKTRPGIYTVTLDLDNMRLNLSSGSEVEVLDAEESEVRYFDLMGREVPDPVKGMYIKVSGGKASKVII